MAKWLEEFKRGRDVLDKPMPDRPADVISQEMVVRVERLALNDRTIKIAELASEYSISNGSNYTIIHGQNICQVGTKKHKHARSTAKGGVKFRSSGSVQC